MNSRRLLPALLVATLISGLFTFWLSRRLPKPSAAPASRPMRGVVAVAHDVPAGAVLQASALAVSDWPAAQPLQGAFSATGDVAGRVLLYPLSAGEPVLAHQLAAAGAGSGLMTRIPDGMRAISVHADEVTGVAGFLVPGSSVDVLATYKPATGPDFVSCTVLQNVRVLAVGQNSEPAPDTKPSTAATVTLLVSPQSAEKVTLAASLGRIVFVLRNGTDAAEVAGLSGASAFSATEAAAPVRTSASRAVQVVQGPRRVAEASSHEGFSVETVSGHKQTQESFGGGSQ